jgi:predicted DNA-binding transcriptional regulator AlpA
MNTAKNASFAARCGSGGFDPLWDTNVTSEYTGLAVRTLTSLRTKGGGPRYVKLGRLVKYRKSDLDAFIAAGVRDNTSQTVAP